ncbi:MAG: hypothetical protein NVS3B6_03920 [Pseudarthrobacter sp.]
MLGVALMVSGIGFLLEFLWSSPVVNPAWALFYSVSGPPVSMRGVSAKIGR